MSLSDAPQKPFEKVIVFIDGGYSGMIFLGTASIKFGKMQIRGLRVLFTAGFLLLFYVKR